MTITKNIAGLVVLATLSTGIQAFAATVGTLPTPVPTVMKVHTTETASSTKKVHLTTKKKVWKKVTTASSTKPTPTIIKKEVVVKKPIAKPVEPKKPTSSSNSTEGSVTAICNDGTESHAVNHSGACSDHGGVKTFTQQ